MGSEPDHPRRLPWWTWLLPLLVSHVGTWLSIWFKTDPGTSLWYLPTAFGIVMIFWWGPRVLLGLFLNATLCAFLWDLPWQWSPVYALPETLEVFLAWLLFARLAKGDFTLPNLPETVKFISLGSLAPALIVGPYLVLQLLWLGDIASSAFWQNVYIITSADVASHLVFAVPTLFFCSSYMSERGWTLTTVLSEKRLCLPEGRNSAGDQLALLLTFIGIPCLASLLEPGLASFLLFSFLLFSLAIRYGMTIAILASSWVVTCSVLVPVVLKSQFSLTTSDFDSILVINIGVVFSAATSILIGRTITDWMLETSRRKRVEESFLNSEETARTLLNATHDSAFLVVPSSGEILALNETAAKSFGKSIDDIVGLRLHDLVPKEVADSRMAYGLEVIKTGQPVHFQDERHGMHFDTTLYPVFDSKGKVAQIAVFAQDITASVKDEEAIREKDEQLNDLLSNVGVIILEGTEHEITYVGGQVERILGYPLDDWYSHANGPVGFWGSKLHQDDMDKIETCAKEILDGHDHSFEYRMIASDGREVWFFDTVTVDKSRGEPYKTRAVMVDITERILAEKEKLITENRSELAQEAGNVGIWDWNPVTDELVWSDETYRILGLAPGEIKPSTELFFSFVHPDDRVPVEEAVAASLNDNQPYSIDCRIIGTDGSERVVAAKAVITFDSDGTAVRMVGTFQDVTERRDTLNALQESEERFRTIVTNSVPMVFMFDNEGVILLSEGKMLSSVGLKPGELVGKNVFESFAEFPNVVAALKKPLSGETFEGEIEMGDQMFEVFYSPNRDTEGNIVGVIGMSMDITERKDAQVALEESEARFRTIITNSSLVIFMYDNDGTIRLSEGKMLSSIGIEPGELVGQNVFEYYSHFPDLMDKLKLPLSGETYEGEIVMGDVFFDVFYAPNRDAKGEVIGGIGMALDITERKRAEEALKVSVTRLQIATEATHIGHWDWDLLTNDVYFSPEWKRQIGFEDHELVNSFETWESLLHPDDLQNTVNAVTAYIEGKREDYEIEFRLKHKDGTYRWIYTRAEKQLDDSGVPCRLFGCHVDITERKEAEQALKDSESKFKAVLDNSRDLLYEFNLKTGTYDYMSPSLEHMVGVSVKDYIDGGIELAISLLHPDDRERMSKHVEHLLASKIEDDFDPTIEYRFNHPKLGYRWFSDSRSVVFDENGEPATLVGNSRDITDRKLSEEALIESARRLNDAQARAQVGNWSVDLVTGDVTGSDELFRIFDLEHDEASLEAFVEVVHPDDREYDLKHIQRGIDHGESWDIEHRLITKKGTHKSVHAIGEAFVNEIGKTIMLVGTVQDITERKKAEVALQASEVQFRLLFETSPLGLAMCEMDGTFVQGNQAFLNTIGYSHEEALKLSYWDVTPIEFEDQEAVQLKCLQNTGRYGPFEKVYVNKRGQRVPVLLNGMLIKGTDGIERIWSIVEDITDRKQAEEELRQSEEKYRGIVETSQDLVWRCDKDGLFTYLNPAWEKTIGYTTEEMLKHHFAEFKPEDVLEKDAAEFKKIYSGQDTFGYETVYLSKSGERRDLVFNALRVKDADGNAIGTQGTAQDITERKKAEAERERLMSAIEQSADSIIITDAQAVIQYVNPAFEVVTGFSREEVIGQNPSLLNSGTHSSEFFEDMWAKLRSGKTWAGRITNRKKQGAEITEEINISPVLDTLGNIVNYVAVQRDVTHVTLLEEQLRQAQKMESIGRLAGGVAHDLNNLLSPILGYSELMSDDLDKQSEHYNYLAQIIKAGSGARDLVAQLLAFSRKQTLVLKFLDLNQVVREFQGLLKRTVPEDIHIEYDLSYQKLPIKADPRQVEQIIMNLAVNAADAMPSGGEMKISTSIELFDESRQSFSDEIPVGNYATLSVSDTGIGIDQDSLERIFEPFFSTKGEHGTGLGLATVYGITKQHNGYVNISTKTNAGTTLQIILPLTEGENESETAHANSENNTSGTEAILVVEDYLPLRQLANTVLTRKGYEVFLATDGLDALTVLEEHGSKIDLLLTDVVMPNMNGKDLYEAAKKKFPSLKVIYMSGYDEEHVTHHGILQDQTEFIRKPFTIEGLAARVREVLSN